MYFRTTLFLSLIALQSSFAIFPTLSCEQGQRSLVLEEGVDEFFLDIKDSSYPGSFIGNLLKTEAPLVTPSVGTPVTPPFSTRPTFPVGNGDLRLVQFKMPKADPLRNPGQQTCRFGETKQMLALCNIYSPDLKLKVTNVGDGTVEELKLGYLTVASSLVRKESLDYQGKELVEEVLRVSLRTTVQRPAPPAPVTPPSTTAPPLTSRPITFPARPFPGAGLNTAVSADIEFPLGICKLGERPESPSR